MNLEAQLGAQYPKLTHVSLTPVTEHEPLSYPDLPRAEMIIEGADESLSGGTSHLRGERDNH